ncbi:MAG: hypothetical protein ACE14V_13340 [bacterium]
MYPYKCNYFISIICFMCLWLLLYSFSFGVELSNKDSIAAQVLLKSNELQDFVLKHNDKYSQDWNTTIDNKTVDLSIGISIYNSSSKAILGNALRMRSVAAIFSYGGFFGCVLGDKSWFHSNSYGTALYFVKDNVGGFIEIRGDMPEFKKKIRVVQITNLLIDKINKVEQPEIKNRLNQARKSQITNREFSMVVQEIPLSGYSLVTESDSIWTINTDTMVLGRREELKDTRKNTIGIDIAKLSSNEEAIRAGKEQAKLAITGLYLDDISKPIPSFPKWWKESGSIVFTKRNYAIHIYQHSIEKNLDTSIFSKLISAIANNIK